MKLSQSFIIAILGTFIASVSAEKSSDCTLSIDNGSLKVHSRSLRIHGHSSHSCSSTSSIIVSSKKDLSFKDKNHNEHKGSQCTFTLEKPYKHLTGSNKQVTLPFSYVKDITCNKDISKRHKYTRKAHRHQHEKKRKTTTTKKSTTTTKKSTTTTKKSTTTTKKPTTTTKKSTTTTKKSTTTTKKSTTTTKKSTTTTKKKTTTTTKKKTTTTTKKSTASSTSGMTSGTVTFFTPNTGACGKKNDDDDLIVALGGDYYGSFSKKSSYCGRKMYIETSDGKKSVTVTVEDACEGCGKTHLDLSPAAFAKLGSFNTGVLNIKYKFL